MVNGCWWEIAVVRIANRLPSKRPWKFCYYQPAFRGGLFFYVISAHCRNNPEGIVKKKNLHPVSLMKQFNVILIAFFFLLNGPVIKAQEKHPDIQWFKDAKFGLFIHWGLYAELGGVYKGRNYYGSGEWIMNQAKIPAAEYAGLAKDFNPVNFNAEEWAQ